jgi:hypothetical protein
MAETETGDFESRLTTLENSLDSLRKDQQTNTRKITAVHKDVTASLRLLSTTGEMLREIRDLTQRAAPLLDSPLAKMAQSPAGAGMLSLLGKGRSRG